MTKAIMATALLALCIAIQIGCGSLRPAAPPTPLPPATPLPAPPAPTFAPTLAPATPSAAHLPQHTGIHLHLPPLEPMLVEELVLYIDVAARVRLLGVAQDIAVEKSSWNRAWDKEPGPYVGVVEFRFEVLEWLKGGDGSATAVGVHIVANGRTEADARADGAWYSERRDKRWDDREAIVFMNNSHKDAPSTQEHGRYLIGHQTWQGYDSFSFNAIRTWLPMADASQASGASGEPEFLLQDPDGSSAPHIAVVRDADGKVVAETLAMTKLRNLLALSAENLDERALRQEGLGVTDTSMSPETNISELHAVTRLGDGTYIIWEVSATNPDVIGYRLLRRKGSDPEIIELADEPVDGERGYVDTHDIQHGTKYTYILRAYGAAGDIADAHLTIATRPALDPLDDATATPTATPTTTPAPK